MAIIFVSLLLCNSGPQIEVFYFITLLEGKYPLHFNEYSMHYKEYTVAYLTKCPCTAITQGSDHKNDD